jgi:hypothetical protein
MPAALAQWAPGQRRLSLKFGSGLSLLRTPTGVPHGSCSEPKCFDGFALLDARLGTLRVSVCIKSLELISKWWEWEHRQIDCEPL